MKQHKGNRGTYTRDAAPTTNINAPGGMVLPQFEGYTVADWCPSLDGSGPAEAVVLVIEFKGSDVRAAGRPINNIALRIKTRQQMNILIETLEEHRDSVWPLQ